MSKRRWKKFPAPSDDFDYAGPALAEHWDRLHRSDREPFPDASQIEALCSGSQAAMQSAGALAEDFDALAEHLQAAWRSFHRGDFADAAEQGLAAGIPGFCVANKATIIYADHLETNEEYKRELYETCAERAEQAMEAFSGHANSRYLHASALGRYSQSISVVKALAQGLGGRIRESLDDALTLDDEHAEAHMALGLYHAEIIDKVGSMVGGLTYGAKKEISQDHFSRALELVPDSALIHMEYGNSLLMLFGDKRIDDATDAYVKASEIEPGDAQEYLDVELAKSELE